MDIKQEIRNIRELLTAADTDGALHQTRLLLEARGMAEPLAHLDMIESEWNDLKEQDLNGILSLEDKIRLQNTSRARLLQLLLDLGGDTGFDANLTPGRSERVAVADHRQQNNNAFRDGLKNAAGVLLLIGTIGALVQGSWLNATAFGVAGIITFLPTLRLIEKTVRYELLSWQKYVIVIGALILVGAINQPKKANTTRPDPVTAPQ